MKDYESCKFTATEGDIMNKQNEFKGLVYSQIEKEWVINE